MGFGRHNLVKVFVLVFFFNSLVATSVGSELNKTITFISKNPGTDNVEIKITYPSSLYCSGDLNWNGGSTDKVSGSCSTSAITFELILDDWFARRALDDTQFKWRQVYFVNGKTIILPWQDFFMGLDHQYPQNLFSIKSNPPRFYPNGELQIEFNGLETLSYFTKDSLPRIKLLGRTKAEEAKAAEKAAEEESSWEFDSFNDGIDNFIYVDQVSENNRTLRIYCQKKRLGAWISAEYANSRGWKGSAQIRFDSKPVKNLSYTINRQFDLISIDNPKPFLSELLKSKKVLVKIGTVNGSQLTTFFQGKLKTYKKQFSAKGCNIG